MVTTNLNVPFSAGVPSDEDFVALPVPLSTANEPTWRVFCLGKQELDTAGADAQSLSTVPDRQSPNVNMLLPLTQVSTVQL